MYRIRRQVWYLVLVLLLAIFSIGGICRTSGGLEERAATRRAGGTPAVGEEDRQETPLPTVTRPLATTTRLPFVRKETDTLTLPGDDPTTLDPHLTGDVTSAEYVVEIFSGLVTLNKDLEIVPDIAQSWDVSADGKVYTFHLREDVRFHNGKKVTAQDFKDSFERCADPRTMSTVADTYLGDIVGVRDKLNGRAKEVKGVKVINDSTLEIMIDAPKAYFLAKMTYPTAFVLDMENVKRGGWTWTDQPNGTGPFKLERYDIGERLVLARNENFYGPKAALKRVNFVLTGGSMMTMYENGELDAVPVSIIDIDRVLDPTNPLNKELSISPSFGTFYIALNAGLPPFDDVKVRQAFSMAIHKELMAEVVLKEMVEPAWTILPPGMPGHNEKLEGLPYDPERARELIAESKYGSAEDLPEITFYISGVGGSIGPIASAVVEMLSVNLGVEVAIQQAETAIFFSDIAKRPNPYQMYSIGWIADYPDPQDFLEIKLHSKSLNNQTGYANPEVDRLLDEAGVEQDEEKRLALYQKAEELIVQDAPWILLWYDIHYWLTKPDVKGLIFPPMVIPKLGYVSIEGQ